MICMMKEENAVLPYFELIRTILGCCFEVMKEIGPGFQERIHKNALLIAMKQNVLEFKTEEQSTEKPIPF